MELLYLLQQHDQGSLSFEDSVALFFKCYPNKEKTLASFFDTEDEFSWKKLRTGLDDKMKELLANQNENKFKTITPSVHQEKPINLTTLPLELRQEYARLSPIIREIAQLHARLPLALNQKSRFDLAEKIVELTQERRAIFIKVDSFVQSGFYEKPIENKPEPVDASKLKNFQLEYDLKLLRSRRSKAKKNPARLEEFNALSKQIIELEAQRYV